MWVKKMFCELGYLRIGTFFKLHPLDDKLFDMWIDESVRQSVL